MNTNDGFAGTGFTLGVIPGLVVGAGVALLFAPKAGRELRHDLGESMGNLRKAVSDRYREIAHGAGVEMENLEATAERAVDAVETGARQFVQEVGGRSRTRA